MLNGEKRGDLPAPGDAIESLENPRRLSPDDPFRVYRPTTAGQNDFHVPSLADAEGEVSRLLARAKCVGNIPTLNPHDTPEIVAIHRENPYLGIMFDFLACIS
jgi:hypothetical protein